MRAFSLIETLVVIAILGVVGTAITSAIQYFYRGNAYIFEETAAVESARTGLANALHDLREASYGDDGSYPIAAAATSTVTFYADVDGSGSVERVRYYLSSGTLYRGVTSSTGNPPSYAGQPEATSTVATYVKNPSTTPLFTFYDANGAALVSPVSIISVRSVHVELDVDLNPTRAPNVYTLVGGATMRNIISQ